MQSQSGSSADAVVEERADEGRRPWRRAAVQRARAIVGHEYEPTPPSKSHFGFRTKKSSHSRSHFVTETWANFFFAPGGQGNAFPTLPHAPQCIPDVRNHDLKITPNLPPAGCSTVGSVPILGHARPSSSDSQANELTDFRENRSAWGCRLENYEDFNVFVPKNTGVVQAMPYEKNDMANLLDHGSVSGYL